MTNQLIHMFMDMNPGNKQLIFATYEMRLLTTDIFRKDKIWFVAKKDGDSELTPLDEIKTFDKHIEKTHMPNPTNSISSATSAIPEHPAQSSTTIISDPYASR